MGTGAEMTSCPHLSSCVLILHMPDRGTKVVFRIMSVCLEGMMMVYGVFGCVGELKGMSHNPLEDFQSCVVSLHVRRSGQSTDDWSRKRTTECLPKRYCYYFEQYIRLLWMRKKDQNDVSIICLAEMLL